MTQLSLKEFLSNVDNQRKIAEGISIRQSTRDTYDPADWTDAKHELVKTQFPEKKFKAEAHKVDIGESHDSGKESHSLTTFELKDTVAGFDAIWKVSYCGICNKVITKYGVIFNTHENCAYKVSFTRHGNQASQETYTESKQPKTQDFEKILDNFMVTPLKGGENK